MAINLQEPIFRYPGGVGYKVYAYAIGATTTPISTYSDPDGQVMHPWPVVLADDATGDGAAAIYLDRDATIEVKDTDDVTVPGYPVDWIRGVTTAELAAVEEQLSARLDEHDGDITLLQSRASDLEERMDSAEADIALAQNAIISLDGRLDTAETEIDLIQLDIISLDGRLNTAESDIDALQAADVALDSRLDAAESDIDALQAADVALDSRLDAAESDIDALQAADVALDSRLDAAESDIISIDGRIDTLEGLTHSEGGSNYSWNRDSDTLEHWGTASSVANGDIAVNFDIAFDSAPKVFLQAIWTGSAFVAAKIKTVSTTGFTGFAARITGGGAEGDSVTFNWLSIGKKA